MKLVSNARNSLCKLGQLNLYHRVFGKKNYRNANNMPLPVFTIFKTNHPNLVDCTHTASNRWRKRPFIRHIEPFTRDGQTAVFTFSHLVPLILKIHRAYVNVCGFTACISLSFIFRKVAKWNALWNGIRENGIHENGNFHE